MDDLFERFTTSLARFIGRPFMLFLCVALAVAGILSFVSGKDLFISGTNLTINVLTLLLLPILQATQNHDGAALQAKIDELIKANELARNDLIGLEQRGGLEIEELRPTAEGVTDPEAAEAG